MHIVNKYSFIILFFINNINAQNVEKRMNEMWGEQTRKVEINNNSSVQLFKEGHYAMFIHWGLFSKIAGEWEGKTYYGISEWIMHPLRANITAAKYKDYANEFNPVNFNAAAIVQLAKDAGMKYIIITSKHHDGFAMYHSKISSFNIYDATPFKRDPMKELSEACSKAGIGFGFYYSHNQDWTYPGGNGGPKTDSAGNLKKFDDYFKYKCYPQVQEITSGYGPIKIIWFDTPGDMKKEYAQQLVDLVHQNQPDALVSGRVGYNLGDYVTMGDMEVPLENEDGLWETVDVTNDSWGYAKYDQNWKTPKQVLINLISTIARGGTYMLNIGPKPDGSVPENAVYTLTNAGKWVHTYPQVVYGTSSSPWKHALPWGDVISKDNKLFLCIYQWPSNGKLFLPGLKSSITHAKLLSDTSTSTINYIKENDWVIFNLPCHAPEKLISVVELTLEGKALVDPMQGVDPVVSTTLASNFANCNFCEKKDSSWMEKFGEWKKVKVIKNWNSNSTAIWDINVIKSGNYLVELNYAGSERLVWSIETDEGIQINNQQNASSIFAFHSFGWLKIDKNGKHIIRVKLKEGSGESTSLISLRLTPIE